MNPLAPESSSTKLWLGVMAAAAMVFFGATMYSAFRAVQGPDVTSDETPAASAAQRPSPGLDLEGPSAATSAMLLNGKPLPLKPAPVNPAFEKQSQLYVTPEVARKEAEHKQAQYLADVSRKYPDSPLTITPEELEKMQKEGRMAW